MMTLSVEQQEASAARVTQEAQEQDSWNDHRQASATLPKSAHETKEKEKIGQDQGSRKRALMDQEDPMTKSRSKRLFGNLVVGTLQKLKSQGKSEATLKRELLEQKLQAKLKKEKEELQQKLDQDLKEKKDKLLQQRKQEDSKRLEGINFTLEEHYLKYYQEFLQTETQPPLFFSPAKHSPRTLELLEKTRKKYQDLLKEHQLQNIPETLQELYPSLQESTEESMEIEKSSSSVKGEESITTDINMEDSVSTSKDTSDQQVPPEVEDLQTEKKDESKEDLKEEDMKE